MKFLKHTLLFSVLFLLQTTLNAQLITYSQTGFLTKVKPESNWFKDYKTYDYQYFMVRDINQSVNKTLNTYGPEIDARYLSYKPEAPDFKFVTAIYNAAIDERRRYSIKNDTARCYIALDYLFTAFDRSGNKVTSYKVIDTFYVLFPAQNSSIVNDNIWQICSKAIQQSQQGTWNVFLKKWFGYNDYSMVFPFISTFVNREDFKETNYAVEEVLKAATQEYDVQDKVLNEQRQAWIDIASKTTGKSAAEVKSIALYNACLTYLILGEKANAEEYFNKSIEAGEYEGKIKYAYKEAQKTYKKRKELKRRKPSDVSDSATTYAKIEDVRNAAAFLVIKGKLVTNQKTPKEYTGDIKIAYYKLYPEKKGNILDLDKVGKNTNNDPITVGENTFSFSNVDYIIDDKGVKYEIKSDYLESSMWKPVASNDKFTIYTKIYPYSAGSIAFIKAGDPKLYVVNYMNKKSIYSKVFTECPEMVEYLMEQDEPIPSEIMEYYRKNCIRN